jgi:hypothetical protein
MYKRNITNWLHETSLNKCTNNSINDQKIPMGNSIYNGLRIPMGSERWGRLPIEDIDLINQKLPKRLTLASSMKQ